MSQLEQKRFNKFFPTRLIAYEAGFAIIFNSPTTAILLGQLLYWYGKGFKKEGWIYKTTDDIYRETGLTRYHQETAIKKLRRHGIIDYKLAGIPATRHFRLDLKKLEQIIPSLMETNKLHYLKPPNSGVEKQQSITESTQKNTSKITTIVDQKSLDKAKADLIKKFGVKK